MPPIDAHIPHRSLLALHQLVDAALHPLLGPMEFDWITDSVVCVDAADLQSLTAPGEDPPAALVTMEGADDMPAMLVAEPALCRAVLAKIWSTDRNSGAPLTQVESAILQQFLADVARQWRGSWSREGIECLPALTLATTLSMLRAQMPSGSWYVARTSVLRRDEPVGVLLFCYPAPLLPALDAARASITWRSRIERGLSDAERARLADMVSDKLRDVVITAPVRLNTSVPLGIINQLERGDVISLEASVGADLDLRVLDRPLRGRLARTNGHFAVAVTGQDIDNHHAGTEALSYEDPMVGDGHGEDLAVEDNPYNLQ